MNATNLVGNIRSIRFRITAWYSLSLTLATAFIFISFFIFTQNTLYNQVDSQLVSHGDKLVQLATSERSTLHEVLLKREVFTEFSQIPGMLVVILDERGSIIQSSLAGDSQNNQYSSQYELAKRSENAIFKNQNVSDTPMRFYAKAVRNQNQLVGIILVAHPIDVIQKSLTSLLTILGIVFIVLVLPMILGGYGMARGIMQPIDELIIKLQKISTEHLHERIKNPRTGDEMEELVVTFNNLLDRLQNAFQRERQFITDVAHELKTPLATLQSGIEVVLSKKRCKEEYKEALVEALIDAKRQSKTLSNILDIAWSEASTGDVVRPVNLSELILEVYEVVFKLAKHKEIVIEKALDANVFVAGIGSKDKLARAFLNILENAVKYTKPKGKILILLKKEQALVRVQITDTGIGIADKDLPHIFERFYRGESTDKTLGSGLGLAITQSIIHSHKGKIKVKSTEGKGTTVIVILPSINAST